MDNLIFLGLGFLSASLLGFIAVRIAWRRAIKLTEQRMGGDVADGNFQSLAAMEGSIRRQGEDLQRLTESKAALEENAKAHASEIQSLTDDLNNLHAHYEAARQDADNQRARVAELEAAVMDELHRQQDLEPQLKDLGNEVTRLASQLRRGSPLAAYAPKRRPAPAPLETLESTPDAACQTVEDGAGEQSAQAQTDERPLDERIRALQAGVSIN